MLLKSSIFFVIRLLDKPLCEAILPFHLCLLLKNSRANCIVNCILADLCFGSREGELSYGIGESVKAAQEAQKPSRTLLL